MLLVARWGFPLFRHRNVDHVALRCGSSLSWRRGRSLWSRRFRRRLRFHCFLYIDKVVDVLVVTVVLVPQGMETIEKPRFADHGENRCDPWNPARTSESLGTAPVRHVAQAEIVEVVEIREPLPAESAHPNVRHGTSLGSSSSCSLCTYNPLPSCSLCRFHSHRCGEDNRDSTVCRSWRNR